MKLKVTNKSCPHRAGTIRERMWNLVVAMDGCTPEQITAAIWALCDSNGWSNTNPARPAQCVVARGYAQWVQS